MHTGPGVRLCRKCSGAAAVCHSSGMQARIDSDTTDDSGESEEEGSLRFLRHEKLSKDEWDVFGDEDSELMQLVSWRHETDAQARRDS